MMEKSVMIHDIANDIDILHCACAMMVIGWCEEVRLWNEVWGLFY